MGPGALEHVRDLSRPFNNVVGRTTRWMQVNRIKGNGRFVCGIQQLIRSTKHLHEWHSHLEWQLFHIDEQTRLTTHHHLSLIFIGYIDEGYDHRFTLQGAWIILLHHGSRTISILSIHTLCATSELSIGAHVSTTILLSSLMIRASGTVPGTASSWR